MPWKRQPDLNPDKTLSALLRPKTKILVDQNMGRDVAESLRESGYNAVFTEDVGLNGKSDTTVASFAWKKRRMIWTHDNDFLSDRVLPESRNLGVVVLPGGDGNEDALLVGLRSAILYFGQGPKLWLKTKSEINSSGELKFRARNPSTNKITTRRFRVTANDDFEEWED